MTLASGHFIGIRLSCRITISPILIFWCVLCHFAYFLKLDMYSLDHRFQKCLSITWTKCHRQRMDIDWYELEGSGNASKKRLMRKCPGVNASIQSSSEGSTTNDRLLRQVLIWVRKVHTFSRLTSHLEWPSWDESWDFSRLLPTSRQSVGCAQEWNSNKFSVTNKIQTLS